VQQGELCYISRAGKHLLGNGLDKVVELLITHLSIAGCLEAVALDRTAFYLYLIHKISPERSRHVKKHQRHSALTHDLAESTALAGYAHFRRRGGQMGVG
jgi:hypothetical protein